MKLPRRKIWDLTGESHSNPDGTNRQHLLARAIPGEQVLLQRQPDNPHDPAAIVVLLDGNQIGWISAQDAAELAPLLDAGLPHRAQLHQVTGGHPDYPLMGARIAIAWQGWKMPDPLAILDDQQHHASIGGGARGGLCAIVALAIVVAGSGVFALSTFAF